MDHYVEGDELHFSVYDDDGFGKKDLLGKARLPSAQFHESDFEGPIKLSHANQSDAVLIVKVCLVDASAVSQSNETGSNGLPGHAVSMGNKLAGA
eukprot:gnl/TRDRNA2_/TRDRNA2_175760_c1_seq3.p1 gnl/TRDRNA2_/TRDRNA2_175760_c1~~gnl/TRDRNA2_/TRDRNA2_175760_c1_seq3.p1  ORF type:complete len:104 (+),score=16.59 gnl/TRDRNA2_/TRDRNA2_175760_c1_seq3:29-313(+)